MKESTFYTLAALILAAPLLPAEFCRAVAILFLVLSQLWLHWLEPRKERLEREAQSRRGR